MQWQSWGVPGATRDWLCSYQPNHCYHHYYCYQCYEWLKNLNKKFLKTSSFLSHFPESPASHNQHNSYLPQEHLPQIEHSTAQSKLFNLDGTDNINVVTDPLPDNTRYDKTLPLTQTKPTGSPSYHQHPTYTITHTHTHTHWHNTHTDATHTQHTHKKNHGLAHPRG